MPLYFYGGMAKRVKRPKVGRGTPSPNNPRHEYEKKLRRYHNQYLAPIASSIAKSYAEGMTVDEASRILNQLQVDTANTLRDIALDDLQNWYFSIDNYNRIRFNESVKRTMGIDASSLLDPFLADELRKNAIAENIALITNMPGAFYGDVMQAVLAEYRGDGFSDGSKSLAGRIQSLGDISKKRASLIARDQTAKLNSIMAQARQEDAGITHYEWRTAGDRRVVGTPGGLFPNPTKRHGNHYERDGKIFAWDKPPEDGHPGTAINCFPGDSNIDFSYGCNKLWRRYYSGKLCTLTADSGVCLQATPNHPILTGRGWLPIDAIKKGDYIVQRLRGDNINEVNKCQFESKFSDVFESAHALFITNFSAPGTKFDFHGDGTKNNIDTIHIDSFLADRGFSGDNESIKKLLLSNTKNASTVDAFAFDVFSRNSCGSLPLVGCSFTASDICLRGDQLSFIFAILRHAYKHCIRSTTDGDIIISKYTTDDSARDIEVLRKAFLAFTRKVSGDDFLLWKIIYFIMRNTFFMDYGQSSSPESLAEGIRIASEQSGDIRSFLPFGHKFLRVVKKTTCKFSNHVYNLQSNTGYYTVNGIYVKNCRCFASPVFDMSKIKMVGV